MSKQYSKADMEAATKELVGKFINEQEEVTMGNNNTININNETNAVEENKEDATMKEAARKLTQEMSEKVKDFAGNVKVTFDEETGEIKSNLDDNLNTLKDTLVPAIGYIDGVLGLSALKNELCEIIYDYTANGKSKNSYIKMARKCRESINEQIELLDVDDSEDFKKIVALRQFIGEDENGNVVTQSIFSAFAKGVVWLVKKAVRYIKGCPLFSTDPEANIFGSVGAKIASFLGGFFNLTKAAISIGGTVIKYAVSYTVAGVLKVATIIIDCFKSIFCKAKDFLVEKFRKGDIDEEEDFEDELEEDFEII